MREDTINTESVFEELSRTATADDTSESYEISLGPDEDATRNVERELEELMEQVTGSLPTDEVQFDESIVKENLEELLLMLIALHDGTHGEELLTDLSHCFDAQLSPGTVYPALHSLEEDDVLSMHAKVRTKEYSLADEEYVRATLEQTMVQHLAFGMLLYGFLPRL
ncbi:helix-turn-helix transcriptional regulator [Halopiger djelfimassiliensis]|uniref:helix-turn-helix transcriptional regulator n=1 Tax=Halopiger djelfimassiliensis TaxID=1293047 RepID=UPI000677721A|nr:helix-turn-helix transcriptional regulator [Halopiger djelfimassiliensis]